MSAGGVGRGAVARRPLPGARGLLGTIATFALVGCATMGTSTLAPGRAVTPASSRAGSTTQASTTLGIPSTGGSTVTRAPTGSSTARASRVTPGSTSAAAEVAQVEAAPEQTMEGFGASGAWWPNDLVDFAPAVRERVAELLFGQAGIALSVYRFNIGGGGVGVTNPTRAPASLLVSPGVYDWSRDPGGQLFLQAAKAHGVPILIGFVNSAPPVWTTNGKSCGGSLRPDAETAFGAYLADVVRHFHDAAGISLSFVSPMNEPDSSFGGCGQEGMHVPVGQRSAVVTALAAALGAHAPYARVIADESNKVTQVTENGPTWLAEENAAQHLAAIAHHTYDYPTAAELRQAAATGRRFGKPLWMTEICCYNGRGFGPDYDPTMDGGMWLANTIWEDLTQANDAAFHWWVALSSAIGCQPAIESGCAAQRNSKGWNDGLLYYDPDFRVNGNQDIYFTKRYWVLGAFSRYVRPGAVRHAVSGGPSSLRLLAFSHDGGWQVIAINNAPGGSTPAQLLLHLPIETGLPLHPVGAFETSATHDLASVAAPGVEGGTTLVATVPPQSVTAYLLKQ